LAEKYYWLKLKKDFFKRHDITIIEAMPNGKDYILFYLKLLCESIDHNGLLRFNETIPYSEEMLATLTRTNLDVVRSAMKVFVNLQMIEVLDDETIFMAEVDKMLGSETYWAEKKRQQRIGQCPTDVQSMSNQCPTCPTKSKSKSKSIDIDIDKDIDNNGSCEPDKPKRFIKPSVDEISKYCQERCNNVDANKFFDFYESKGWLVGKTKMKDWKASVRTWERSDQNKSTQEIKMMTGDD
jgi:predicted phage replisome organizer